MRRPLAALCAATVAFAVPTLLVHQAQAGGSHRETVRVGTTAHGRPLLARHQWASAGGQTLLVVGSLRGTGRAGLRVVHRLRQSAPPDSVDLWTIRTINPDGLAAGKRWNAHGVDLNRNFPGGWRQASLSSTRAGRSAASEPETEAIMRFVRDLRPVTVVVLGSARHSRVAAPDGSVRLGRFVARSLRTRFVDRTCLRPCPGSFGRWVHARTDADLVTVRTNSAGRRRVARMTDTVLALAIRGARGGPKPTGSPTASSPTSMLPSETSTAGTSTATAGPTSPAKTSPTSTTTTTSSTSMAKSSPTPSPTTSSTTSPAPPPSPSPTIAPPPAAGGPYLPYTADSYFRTPLDGRVDAAATAAFRAFMHTHPDQKDTPYPVIRGVGGNAWGTAYAEGSASDPVWRLTGTVPSAVAQLQTQGFHAPEWFGAMLTGTSDSPFVVLDRGTGWSVWGAKSRVVGDHLIQVAAAGLFEHTSNGLDKRNPASDSSLNFRSRGAIPDAMVIRKDLVDWGAGHGTDLGHVLHLFFVETDSTAGFRSPMVGAESGKVGWGAEGQRIAIDPTIDLTTRGLSPDALVIARTLQRYGAYLGDNAGGATSLKAEQESSVRDVWHGELQADSLRNITWDDFVVVPS